MANEKSDIKSIHFKIRKWQYNANAKMIKLHTTCDLRTHPLRNNESEEAKGLVFIWVLVISANDIEVLYYSTEEFFIIPERKITDDKLMQLIGMSHFRTNRELAPKNLAVGLDAGLPKLEDIPIDLKRIKSVLDM
jgi:hypothetical protein